MSRTVKTLRWSQKLHRWASYLLFIPLTFWIVGGAVMVLVPLTLVRGDTEILRPKLEALPEDLSGLLSHLPAGLTAVEVRAKMLGARRVIEVQDEAGKRMLFERGTYAPLTPISEGYALDIARWHSSKAKELGIAVRWIGEADEAPSDYRRALPVWLAERTDGVRLYISPDTGEIMARRSKIWRLYDFFWMLHTQDFAGRDNFNNPLVRISASLAVLFLVTGLILTLYRLLASLRRRFFA